MKNKNAYQLYKLSKKGRYYAIIDYIVMIGTTLLSVYLSDKLEPIYRVSRSMTYLSFVTGLILPLHFTYAFKKSARYATTSNLDWVISKKKKYVAGSYYFIALVVLLLTLLLSSDYVISQATQQHSLKHVHYYLTSLYILYASLIFFSLIRWLYAFDYYQSYYYRNKKSYASHIYLGGMGAVIACIFIYSFIMIIKVLFLS